MYSNELVCDIIKYLNSNINKKITINDLVKQYHFNRYYIMKLFKQELDISIIDYINYKRISNSLKSLQNTNDSILKVALDNGFYSQEYFSEMFNKIIGVSPLKYKNFLKHKHNQSTKDIDTVLNNIIKLDEINIKIKEYLNRRRPTNTIKSLSIFK